MPSDSDFRAFLPALESSYSLYSGSMPASEILLGALNWPTGYWPALAIGWIEQGAPINSEIAKRLEIIGRGRQYEQRTRHRSFALHKRWTEIQR